MALEILNDRLKFGCVVGLANNKREVLGLSAQKCQHNRSLG